MPKSDNQAGGYCIVGWYDAMRVLNLDPPMSFTE
jgi:hypothetical protein